MGLATDEQAVADATKDGFDGWAGDLWTFLHTNRVAWRFYGWFCWGAHLPSVEAWVEQQLRNVDAETIVDVPVGIARLAPVYARLRPERLIAVDISAAMIARARAALGRFPSLRTEYHASDVAAMPVSSDTADLVVSEGGFHHFPNRAMAADEMARVLKRPGKLIGYSLTAEGSPLGNLSFRMFNRNRLMGKPLGQAELRDVLESARFSAIETRRFGSVLCFKATIDT